MANSDFIKAAGMLKTISSSGYSDDYERGWNAAVEHNRKVLRCAAGDAEACAAIGQFNSALKSRQEDEDH